MAFSKEKTWHVYDHSLLESAWSDYSIEDLIGKIRGRELLDHKLVKEARKLSKGVDGVRWLGPSYLATYKSKREANEVQTDLDRDLIEGLESILEALESPMSLWEFFSSRRFYERWFSSLPDEVSIDYALMMHVTYTGVRYLEDNFHGILVGPCRERGLLRRNIVSPNVMEVPPTEEVGYDSDFEDAILSVSEGFLRERITREENADSAWDLVSALQMSITFCRKHELSTYITGDKELTIAPELDFSFRKEAHRKQPTVAQRRLSQEVAAESGT